jgi:nucleoside triphosphate diphosphatase
VVDEIGDVLFAVVNIARHLEVDAEAALRRTNAKFERRFRSIEKGSAPKVAASTPLRWPRWRHSGRRPKGGVRPGAWPAVTSWR